MDGSILLDLVTYQRNKVQRYIERYKSLKGVKKGNLASVIKEIRLLRSYRYHARTSE